MDKRVSRPWIYHGAQWRQSSSSGGKYGTTVTLPKTVRCSKPDKKTRRKWVKLTAKEPQGFLARTGWLFRACSLWLGFFMLGQEGQAYPIKRNTCTGYIFQKNTWNLSSACYGLMKPRLKFCANTTSLIDKTTPHALGLFFVSWNWGLSQSGGNSERFQIPVTVSTKLWGFR